MRKTTKTKTRKKTGVDRRSFLTAAGAVPFLPSLLLAAGYAVIAGTVFREPGFALPQARVRLRVLQPPDVKKKPKDQQLLSDARGEFAFRVPAGAARYQLDVSAEGFVPQEKEVAVAADERVDSYFELKAVPK
jgi:hypothetical protein